MSKNGWFLHGLFLARTFLNKRYETRLTPPPRLRKYFIKKRYFLNDGFPKVADLLEKVENYTTAIPDSVTESVLSSAGLQSTDPQVVTEKK